MKYSKLLVILMSLMVLSVTTMADNSAKEIDVDGLKVIYKKSPKNVLSVRLFIRGGNANYPKSQEGIENLALHTAIKGGTESKSKIEFNTAAEKIGASLSSSTSFDFSSLNMTCISMYWDQSWELFTGAVLNPAFEEKEFNLIKEQLVVDARQSESNPDVYLRNLAMSKVFEGKNYAKIHEGTPASLESLELNTVRDYYAKLIDKKKCFLVVVGNLEEADIINKVKNSLAKIPVGKAAPQEAAAVISEADHYIEDRTMATNYIRGIFNAPMRLSEEGVPMQIAMNILGDRYFLELRTKRSLSYAPAAFYATGAITNPYNVIYISTLDPELSMQVMVDEINKVKKEGFLERELKDQKQVFLTYHYLDLETSASQSQELGMAEIAGGWELTDQFPDLVDATTLKDLNRVFDKYTNTIHWVYLGNEEMVEEDDFVQTKTYKEKPY